ncbi:MAG: 23S rRNA (guanosine(2251)-2'-O)-methyltransferase RlmB [Candidatus Caenarcaniphilales bacterium]|nr:23S rRNA (guanosine(2251)-2'-O)-methyltransferase RlmB [Candidatus Caenarcaniphilales bacterium]
MTAFIYGKYPVASFIERYPSEINKLWYSEENHLSFFSNNSFFEQISKQKLSNKELRHKFALKEYESHQGLVLEINTNLKELLFCSVEELIIESSHLGKILLWLPSIQDTHNLGAVIRSCVALNLIHGIILPSSKSVNITPAVAKVSAGSLFNMKFANFSSFNSVTNSLKDNGINLVCMEKRGQSENLWSVNFKNLEPFVLVIGSEDRGIPEAIRRSSDYQIKIPQSDKVESLNLSVATGIVLYEILKQYDSPSLHSL